MILFYLSSYSIYFSSILVKGMEQLVLLAKSSKTGRRIILLDRPGCVDFFPTLATMLPGKSRPARNGISVREDYSNPIRRACALCNLDR